eukprot:gene18432-21992_t
MSFEQSARDEDGLGARASDSVGTVRTEGFFFDDLPIDVLRLILDRQGMNENDARGTMRLFHRNIKRDCRCLYDSATDTFVSPVTPSSGQERDTHCLSGTQALLTTVFCQRLTEYWARLRERMNREIMADERAADEIVMGIIEMMGDALPRNRDPIQTRLLLEAFREYLVRRLHTGDPFNASNLWNAALANYGLSFRRSRFEFATVVDLLCDYSPQAFLIILSAYTDLSRVPDDELVYLLSRIIGNIARNSRVDIPELITISKMVGVDHEGFRTAFAAFRQHAALSVRSLKHLRALLGVTDERYVDMLRLFFDSSTDRILEAARSEIAWMCDDLGATSARVDRLMDAYLQRKLRKRARVILEDVALLCRFSPRGHERCETISTEFATQSAAPTVKEATKLCQLLGKDNRICSTLFDRILKLKCEEDAELSSSDLFDLCSFFKGRQNVCDSLIENFVTFTLDGGIDMTIGELETLCEFFGKDCGAEVKQHVEHNFVAFVRTMRSSALRSPPMSSVRASARDALGRELRDARWELSIVSDLLYVLADENHDDAHARTVTDLRKALDSVYRSDPSDAELADLSGGFEQDLGLYLHVDADMVSMRASDKLRDLTRSDASAFAVITSYLSRRSTYSEPDGSLFHLPRFLSLDVLAGHLLRMRKMELMERIRGIITSRGMRSGCASTISQAAEDENDYSSYKFFLSVVSKVD